MAELEKGGVLRSKGGTAMNAQSSRSHAIFTITLEKSDISDEQSCFTAKLHLVDLAGSERLKKTQAEGTRMMEGIRINEGLLALGNVISALSEPGGNRHIPYRDSKITRLLQDSLGGYSYTLMIACVSPADSNAEETLSTLRYADRAKKIKNKPIVNVDPVQQRMQELKEKVASLERELAEVRMGIAPCSGDGSLSSIEAAELRSALAEKERQMNEAHGKTAEAICQSPQSTPTCESQKERFKTVVNQTIEMIRNSGEVEQHDLVQQISEILTEQVLDEEEKDPSIAKIHHADTDEEGAMDETFSIKFVDQQASLNKELEEVMRQITDKEDILRNTVENQKNVDELLKRHEQEMGELQKRIDALLAEKLKLEADLKKFSVNNSLWLAEERRKKLQEMEKQLALFRKQMNDMKRLEKQRQQSEEMQKRMQAEIAELKKAKVRMVKQQKEEAEKYRQWKIKHDRELHQLKQKERKRDIEAAREKRVHDQQMMVYKQKLEDASRVNKRLQAQMEKAAAFSREKPESEKALKNAKHFIEAELALIGSSYEAELMCQSLKDQRRQLGKKRARLQREKDAYQTEPLPKRRSTEQGEAYPPEVEEALKKIDEELKNIDQQQLLCSHELDKLQHGCTAINIESRGETRWKDLYTVVAARLYLKVLFDQAAHERRTVIDNEKEIKHLQKRMKEFEAAMRDMKKKHEDQLNEVKEKNRSLPTEYDKQKTEAEMHSTSSSSSSSAKPKRLSRSRSRSCISPSVVITTELEKRTRANRARIHRFGNVIPTDVIDTEDSEEEESVADTSYHPNFEHHTHHGEKKKTKLSVVTDLFPTPNLTHIQHESTGEGAMSPRSRRQSRLLHHPPAPIFQKERENICNETILLDSDTSSATGHPGDQQSAEAAGPGGFRSPTRHPDAGDCAPDDPNPLRNATLLSGLVPHLDPDCGPL
ncbi:unnamed protein product [Cylicocyclus nassatus]|uniref:Kinesin-like protein n=1 Tax=Cylicocyclus nassatus TaxID=53992 RepID=A0AA36HET6_CYLNA|nr:unnamed protein product [Cylicocyclus nassatus]